MPLSTDRSKRDPTGEATTTAAAILSICDSCGVAWMKFNRRLGREEMEGEGILSREDIVAVLSELIGIRNGHGA